jgi:hypothetical protein
MTGTKFPTTSASTPDASLMADGSTYRIATAGTLIIEGAPDNPLTSAR